MGRKMMQNQVPVASFNLREIGPITTDEAYAKVGQRWYRCAGGDTRDDRATRDPSPCPLCGGLVEWALTSKREPTAPKGLQRYVYARCIRTDAHRWGFRDTDRSRATVEPTPVEPTPVEPTPVEPTPVEPTPVEPTPKEEQQMAQIDQSNPLAALTAWIEAQIGQRLSTLEAKTAKLDPEEIKRIALDALKGQITTTLEIKSETVEIKLEGVRHPIADEIAERIALGQRAFLLVGPAGTGKTTISEQIRSAFGATGSTIPMSEDMRRENFIGFRGYDIQKGTAPFQDTALIRDLEASAAPTHPWVVSVLEEADAGNANVMLTINTLTNGFLSTPDDLDTPRRARGPNHVLILTANTYGNTQTGSLAYVGRNQLDAATLSRYVTLFVGYDPMVERACVRDDSVVDFFETARRKADGLKMRRVICSRMAAQCAVDRKLTRNKGKAVPEVFAGLAHNLGWSADEISRVC